MLSAHQRKYLATISEEKITHIQPFDPRVQEVGNLLVLKIKTALPELEILFVGAAALGIAGQNDIDLNILSTPTEYQKYLPTLKKLFGEPAKSSPILVKWEFAQEGFEVELYLTDQNSPILKEQIQTFEILRDNPKFSKK